MSVSLDHLVVAAATLDEGVRWCEATLDVTPGPGGKHALMGTHNRLLRIASNDFPTAYLEIIAIDPKAPPPGRARWFGLDDIDLSRGPRLIHWAARTAAIDTDLAALRKAGVDAGEAIAVSRETSSAPLHWRIAVRSDGRTLAGGAMPTLIEWCDRHPATAMPASGVTLRAMGLRGLAPQALTALGLHGVHVANDPGPAIVAMLDTPRGAVTLSTV